MILKKPFAFFIKMFKPIHLLLSGIIIYLVIISNNVLKFFNEYIYSAESMASKEVVEGLSDKFLYIIPIICIVLFLMILGVMYRKNKPIIFYFLGVFSFVVVLVINIYTVNFLRIIIDNVVAVSSIKLIHDLVLINMIVEIGIFIFVFARGVGLDFKKFDFNSDILKLNSIETDNEEFEVNINIDFNERKRKRKEILRNLKYIYIENKLLINWLIVGLILIISLFIGYNIFKNSQKNKEGVYYRIDSVDLKINETLLLNTNFRGNKITDNYLIVVDTEMKTSDNNKKMFLNDFSLKIGDVKFKATEDYFEKLIDLGNFYDEKILTYDSQDYLFVFEIPEKYIKSEMTFSYSSSGETIDIYLNPVVLGSSNKIDIKKLTEKMSFNGVLEGIEFSIEKFEIKNNFVIEYNYCISENDCIPSKEYLKPSINENYDKVILKLIVNYKNSSDLKIKTFYNLLSDFGTLSYKKDGVWYNIRKFEQILSKRKKIKGEEYIGIISNIIDAEEIKIMFNVRGEAYEYILKQVSE